MKQALISAALCLVATAALGTSQALADTYCAELAGDATCTQNFTGTSSAIQAAVTAADENPGPDTVKVGPGTFVMPSPIYLGNSGDDNKLTLVGSGTGETILTGADVANPDIHFSGGTGSIISSLTISIPDEGSNAAKLGLALQSGATGDDLSVTFASGTTGNRTTGVRLTDGSILKNSDVRLYNTNVNSAVDIFGSGKVLNSSLTALRSVDQRNSTGTVEVRHSALVPLGGIGGQTLGGTMKIIDSVIVNAYGGYGVYVRSGGTPTTMLIDGTTIVGVPGPDEEHPSVGAVVLSEAGPPTPADTKFRFNNSLIYGQDFAAVHNTSYAEDKLDIDVDSSAYDSTRVAEQPALGTAQITVANLVELNGVNPKFKDPEHGDYSLAADSPLIDAGQVALPEPGALAFDGNPRACDGNDDGMIRRDIGAFELKTDPVDDCTYSTASIGDPQGAATDTSRTFVFTASKPGSTYLCSMDGADFKACPTPYTAPGLSVGSHTLNVKARDAYGNVQTPPTEKSFEVKAPGCVDDPGLCPDKTAPKVVGLKAPKMTKASWVVVRFRSDEAGVKFTCRLNGGRAKICRSPWKTPKLKQGKNTIAVQATDKAGNKSTIVKRAIKKRSRR